MKKDENQLVAEMRSLHPDALTQETITVDHTFTDSELAEKNEEHTDLHMQLDDAEAEFKQIKTEHTSAMKNTKEKMKSIRRELKSGKTTSAVLCDLVPDYVSGFMQFIDGQGEIVHTRRLKPSEKQLRVDKEASTVTDRSGTNG